MRQKNSCICEKAYLDFRVHSNQDLRNKNILRLNFKNAQKNFDKKFRYLKRQHHKNQFRDLDTNATKHPAAMWEALKKLDNRPNVKAALEIIEDDRLGWLPVLLSQISSSGVRLKQARDERSGQPLVVYMGQGRGSSPQSRR